MKQAGARRKDFELVEWCEASGIPKVFTWPAAELPENIYREGGFRHVETAYAGRAARRKIGDGSKGQIIETNT